MPPAPSSRMSSYWLIVMPGRGPWPGPHMPVTSETSVFGVGLVPCASAGVLWPVAIAVRASEPLLASAFGFAISIVGTEPGGGAAGSSAPTAITVFSPEPDTTSGGSGAATATGGGAGAGGGTGGESSDPTAITVFSDVGTCTTGGTTGTGPPAPPSITVASDDLLLPFGWFSLIDAPRWRWPAAVVLVQLAYGDDPPWG